MSSLFPNRDGAAFLPDNTIPVAETNQQITFGRSWTFDHRKGDFAMSPSGRVEECSGLEAWVQWCHKTMRTGRYRHVIYSRSYGQEFDTLIPENLTRAAVESEIERMVREALMEDPRTAEVDSFEFRWEKGIVYFTCRLLNVLDEEIRLEESVVIGQ